MKFIKVGEDVAICATRIVAVLSTNSYQARQTLKEERKAGTLVNASGRESTKCAIVLDNGTVIASPLSVTRILTAIETSSHKRRQRTYETQKIKVFDAVVAEEPVSVDPFKEEDEEETEVLPE